jgi:hypothetical protein
LRYLKRYFANEALSWQRIVYLWLQSAARVGGFVATLGSDGRAVKFYFKHGFELEVRLSDYYYRDEDKLILGRYL